MKTGFLRAGTRTTIQAAREKRAGQSLADRANAVIDALVARDADRAREWLDKQASATPEAPCA